ncbi:MAG: hypothetical protein IKW99_03655 [Bacteroidales bacterium]|nr:hypothetical protein [Bacteroidales bacterium]
MTGCGATSLAIEQKGPTILAVPFVGLIENKKKRYGDALLGIYGEGDKTAEVAAYLLDHREDYKIAVTYDSLPKLIRTMRALGHDPYKEAFLAIDE